MLAVLLQGRVNYNLKPVNVSEESRILKKNDD